ncbi:hypothetical protein HGG64_01685 [Mycoplasma phocoeninasale]|uniref:Lipoprotein n=1 Tax=Mycoplasma phocoeninasale TaxID=2726117 RepID=A0A858U6K7_9MOLU|nr:hypothetical protein [Mycoplasma phocoeninasale]QJG66418.1 hypothetical protein HGG64_01685 [Mycoplasma phocoeninasale]
MKMKKFKWLAALSLATFALPLIAASCGTIKIIDGDGEDKSKPIDTKPEKPSDLVERNDESPETKALVKLTLENFVKGLNAENEEKYKEFIGVINKMNKNSDAKIIFDYYNSEKANLVSIINENASLSKKFETRVDAIKSFEDIYRVKREFKEFEKKTEDLKKYLADNGLTKEFEEEVNKINTLENIDETKKMAKDSITIENVTLKQNGFVFSLKNREFIAGEKIQFIVYITSDEKKIKYLRTSREEKIEKNSNTYYAKYQINRKKVENNVKFKVHLLGVKITNTEGIKYYWVPGFDFDQYDNYLKDKKSLKLNEGDESLKYFITL